MVFRRFQELATRQEASATDFDNVREHIVVMVVDDDPHVRNTLELLLRQQGYDVVLCEDGDDGLRKMNAEVAAVVLDIKMPGKDGFQVYMEMKASYPQTPIIFYSAYQNIMEDIEIKRSYNPFSYVNKNGESEALLMSLKRAISYYRTKVSLEESRQQLLQGKTA